MKLTGEFCTVGDLDADDAPTILGVPAIQIRLANDRVVTLTGLTRDECRAAAPLLMHEVTLTLAPVEPQGADI